MRNRIMLVATMATFVVVMAGCGQTREESTARAEQPSADANGTAANTDAAAAEANGTAYGTNTAAGTVDRSPSPGEGSTAPDNTGVNTRDRNDANPTADDQSHSPADLDLTRRVRQAVVDDDSLSANGKNVKIISRDGKVTLRGPVKDENERKAIGDKAALIAGAGNVENQLEVAR